MPSGPSVWAYVIGWTGHEEHARQIAAAIEDHVDRLVVVYSHRSGTPLSGAGEWRQVSDDLSIGRETTPTLSPATVAATENAINQYQAIVDHGGWNIVPDGHELRLGSRGRAVQALRERLAASGDLDANAGMGATFDSFVDAAVKRFQTRHGLGPTGVVDVPSAPLRNHHGRRRPAIHAVALVS